MATCRCRDTGTRRCRWEHPSDYIAVVFHPRREILAARVNRRVLVRRTFEEATS